MEHILEDISSFWRTEREYNEPFRKCYFCIFTSVPTFILRGMSFCQTEHFDQKYKWTESLQDNRYVLQGLQGSRIASSAASQDRQGPKIASFYDGRLQSSTHQVNERSATEAVAYK